MTQNVVSSGMDLAGVIPKYLNIRRGGILMCIFGIIIQPWRFVTGASTFVTVIASFGGETFSLGLLAGRLTNSYAQYSSLR